MRIYKHFTEIMPNRTYSVSEAARYLGVHRCTVYAYINHPEQPLPFNKSADNERLLFHGGDLIAYKKVGLPKKGRKRNRVID